MKITFDNILEIVNSRTISRKEKQNAIRVFLKENSGDKKPTEPEHIAIIEQIKTIKKSYSQMDSAEKIKNTEQHSF